MDHRPGIRQQKIFARLLDKQRSFIIRLKLSDKVARLLVDEQHRRGRAGRLARHTERPYFFSAFRGHTGIRGRFGWRTVSLPGRDEELTLVVFGDRQDEPVALLTNVACTTAQQALHIIDDYLGRWFGAEDPVRFLKQAFRLEKFLVDGMDGIRAWFFILMVAFSLLWTLAGGREILRWILRSAQPFDKKVRFAYYRILRGFKRLLRSFEFPTSELRAFARPP